jgi:hypothetical protein
MSEVDVLHAEWLVGAALLPMAAAHAALRRPNDQVV